MPKKSFKDNPALAFIGNTQETQEAQQTQSTTNAHNTQEPQQTHYRINLKLRPEFRQYLDDEAWKARKSITEYLNDLIAADMAAKNEGAGE